MNTPCAFENAFRRLPDFFTILVCLSFWDLLWFASMVPRARHGILSRCFKFLNKDSPGHLKQEEVFIADFRKTRTQVSGQADWHQADEASGVNRNVVSNRWISSPGMRPIIPFAAGWHLPSGFCPFFHHCRCHHANFLSPSPLADFLIS